MQTVTSLILAAAVVVTAPAQELSPGKRLLEAVAPSIVAVEATLSIDMSMRGQSRKDEANFNLTGVVVAPNLVMIDANGLDPTPDLPPGMELSVTPVGVKILLPGTDDEFEAEVVATDDKLGITFLSVADLGDRKLSPVALERTAKPVVGGRIFTVDRLAKGFDHAPIYRSGEITGRIKKPRRAFVYALRGGSAPGDCVFNDAGEFLGIVARIESATGEGGGRGLPGRRRRAGSGRRSFIVPARTFQVALESALKAAKARAEKGASGGPEEGTPDAESTTGGK
jgi:hypothetical protein